jgi:DNA-binding NarL/FixJ family response regulator
MNVKRITVEARAWVAHDPNLRNLTNRQREVAYRLAEGMSIGQIAAELGISCETADHFLGDIRRRMRGVAVDAEEGGACR